MTDQQDRHDEAFDSETTKYERELDEEQRRREEAAEQLENDPLPARED